MSIWGTIAGIVAAPFTGGASLIPSLVSAGADIAGAAIGSHAAGNAAQQQQNAAQQQLALYQQIYQNQQKNLAPYMAIGPGALANLGGLTGQRMNAAPPYTTATSPQGLSGPVSSAPGFTPPTYAGPGAVSQTWQGPGVNPFYAPGTPGYQAQAGGQSMVTLRAPDGSTRAVPSDQVNHYLSLGATPVGG